MTARAAERIDPPTRAAWPQRITAPCNVIVAGAGLAGLAAATVLAERGAGVTLLERAPHLGGRAGAWDDRLADGTPFQMERGFHAFFRQYYNLRALLRRVDPALEHLRPAGDYPILAGDGGAESFAGLPVRPPWNIAALTLRTDTLRLRDLARVNVRAALEMLRYERGHTYGRFDGQSARDYLDSLRFPPAARQRLLHVFTHSLFNPQEDLSAAELLQLFHCYFTGHREGLLFDVAARPFSTAFFRPLGKYLADLGVRILTGCPVRAVHTHDGRWIVSHEQGEAMGDAVVLALDVTGLREVVGASDLPAGAHPARDRDAWLDQVATLRPTRPFAVWRLWLDRPVQGDRALFAGTAGAGCLDNISLYDRFEDESRVWARRTGGAVVELHAYALPPGAGSEEGALRKNLLAGLHQIYPETRDARILEDRFLLRADCPAFAPGSDSGRPGVATPFPGLVLAGDFVKLPFPAELMERAAGAGLLAANQLLERWRTRPEPVWSVPRRGVFG